MSQQEVNIGKLKLIEKLNGETLEEQCKRIFNKEVKPLDLPYWDTWAETLEFELEDYVVCKDNLYKVISRNDDYGMDIFKLSKNPDGTFDYILSYYNGGCCFREAVEHAFEQLECDDQ